MITIRKSFIFQTLAFGVLLAVLTSCSSTEQASSADPTNMVELGNQMRAKGNDVSAVEFYQRALQQNPNDLEARKALAEIVEAHGNNAEAVQQFTAALQIDPENGDIHRGLGRLHLKMGQPDKAKEHYNHALQINSRDVKALNGLGVTLDYLGNHVAAQNAYKEALDYEPDDLSALNNLAHSYVLTGAYDEAIKLLEPRIKDKGATPALRQNLAEAYGMNGMHADAERMARMDLTPEQIKHNLSYYKAARAKLSLEPKLSADLGSFPTPNMADARAEDIKTRFADDVEGLIVESKSTVKSIGSTPSFTVAVTGFAKKERLKTFCDKLKKENIACKARGI
jgi:Flp pilus assembly protein TadD